MKYYFMFGFKTNDRSNVIDDFNDCLPLGVKFNGECIDGNTWYDYTCEIDEGFTAGDYIQITDVHRFIINKVIFHLPTERECTQVTCECMCDMEYYRLNS